DAIDKIMVQLSFLQHEERDRIAAECLRLPVVVIIHVVVLHGFSLNGGRQATSFRACPTAHPSGRRFQSSGGDLFGEFPHRTSAGIFIPALGTVALHCSVARLVFESFLMLLGDRLITAAKGNNNLCHSKNRRRERQLEAERTSAASI